MQTHLLSLYVTLLSALTVTCLPTDTIDTTNTTTSSDSLSDGQDAFEAKIASGLAFLKPRQGSHDKLLFIHARPSQPSSSNPDAFTNIRIQMTDSRTHETLTTQTVDSDAWSDPITQPPGHRTRWWNWSDRSLNLRQAFKQAALAGYPGPWQSIIIYWPSQDISVYTSSNSQVVYWLQNNAPTTEGEAVVRVGAKTGKVVPYQVLRAEEAEAPELAGMGLSLTAL